MFRFNSSWLKEEYDTEKKVDQHTSLTDEEKRYLKGVYQRSTNGLAVELSKIDCEFIADAYFKNGKINNIHVKY